MNRPEGRCCSGAPCAVSAATGPTSRPYGYGRVRAALSAQGGRRRLTGVYVVNQDLLLPMPPRHTTVRRWKSASPRKGNTSVLSIGRCRSDNVRFGVALTSASVDR